jgi:hypothetical protein
MVMEGYQCETLSPEQLAKKSAHMTTVMKDASELFLAPMLMRSAYNRTVLFNGRLFYHFCKRLMVCCGVYAHESPGLVGALPLDWTAQTTAQRITSYQYAFELALDPLASRQKRAGKALAPPKVFPAVPLETLLPAARPLDKLAGDALPVTQTVGCLKYTLFGAPLGPAGPSAGT